MVKHYENSNSSSDASTTSSFSSSSKSRKQATKSLIKTNKSINLSAGTNNLCNKSPANSISQSSVQQVLYNNQNNSLFKLSPLSNTNNFNSQQAIHLATMKSMANQLAVANSNNLSTSNTPSTLSAINDQAYFQNTLPHNSDAYKIPAAGALHILTSPNTSNRDSGNTTKSNRTENPSENNRDRDRIGISSNCSNSSNSSNGSFSNGNNTGEIVVEETIRKREMRLLKNREAARECRRKKKEYIKCLENRVAVLENQNKTLIDELKSLKELYCQNGDPTH